MNATLFGLSDEDLRALAHYAATRQLTLGFSTGVAYDLLFLPAALAQTARKQEPEMTESSEPATGPAVWKGGDFAGTNDWIVPLTPKDVRELDDALSAATGKHIPIQQITADDFPLPSLGTRLEALADEIETGRGFGVLRGIPVQTYSEENCKIVSWGLCSYFGALIPQSRQGDWINPVIDLSDITSTTRPELEHIIKRGQLRTNHAGGELDFHTDTTDIFALFCLRNAKSGGASRLVSIGTIHNRIQAENRDYLRALYDGYYYMSQAVDNEGGAPRVSSRRVPVFTRKGDTVQGYYISQVVQRAIDHGNVRYSRIEDEAREEIQRVANAPGVAHEFMLEPGDLLVVNNRAVMHARWDYEDFSELDRRRHLFRLWMATTPEMKATTFRAPSDRFSTEASA